MNSSYHFDNKLNTDGFRKQLPSLGEKFCTDQHKLKIFNSFTKKKDLFTCKDKKIIKWYSCGPTVYDISHLGHARCYLTFDIVRRILNNYFGYHVYYVMNITDIDDKIIKRARSNYLCDKFIADCQSSQMNKDDLLTSLKVAIGNYEKRSLNEKDPDKLIMIKNILLKAQDSITRLEKLTNLDDCELINLLEELRDIIGEEQDFELGHTVTDHQIFKSLAMKYELEYHEDMQKLNVLPPNALTRVSEYIDGVGLFLKKLESNGFAYRTPDGSVYFDTDKFNTDPRHSYAKLVPEAYCDKKSLEEGEGKLTTNQELKKSPNDFVLWKKSKVGEPSWITQDYESGRPGWHIECSVMASDLLGDNFDIHSGGYDLKFPHHDNEIALAEAYYNTGNNWVNYFIHSGHLTISGRKMSKSLKNFITIKQALEEYSSRQLRFAFLSHSWDKTLDYSPNTMNTAIGYEKTFNEFFLNILDTFRRRQNKPIESSQDDEQLRQELIITSTKVDSALCDSFDTRTALNALSALVKEYNKKPEANSKLLRDIADYIYSVLDIFGISFKEYKQAEDEQVGMGDKVLDYVPWQTIGQFRADVRRIIKSDADKKECKKLILTLCDKLRDDTLPNLGVRLEDKEVDGASFVIKFFDPATEKQGDKDVQEKNVKQGTAKLAKLKIQQQQKK